MRHLIVIGGLLAASIPAPSAFALDNEDGEEAAVLAVVEKAFNAVTSQNVEDWRAIQLAEGTTLSFRPDGKGGQKMRMSSNDESADRPRTDDIYLERWIGEPTVMIRGPIAVVWGEYEFFINDRRNHCGVDSIDLVKLEGTWKVANFMWTVEPDGCPTTPADE